MTISTSDQAATSLRMLLSTDTLHITLTMMQFVWQLQNLKIELPLQEHFADTKKAHRNQRKSKQVVSETIPKLGIRKHSKSKNNSQFKFSSLSFCLTASWNLSEIFYHGKFVIIITFCLFIYIFTGDARQVAEGSI